ncbi:MAG TPA: NADH:flavin oxidoreductase [Methylomusa anaerophila]|uniref:NADH oxidase n=1 Tax=Methylomusa anaerophila TaxID=1930071 RepID=A0A348AHH8_9FIRM|nr:NADH:flavin oxidoreductase [Methylomusa anaerophila]BBB90526.1 NADH oxidase [Methylomusa anaerophila]HML89834.1 NADH:flavin oxidoreductase [Methylomusa anaerophila]
MKTLFDETTINNINNINNMKLQNRIIRSATWEGMADSAGRLTNRLIKVYETLANGGVGLIITGGTYFTKDSTTLPGMAGIYEDSLLQDYEKFTDMVHSSGCPIILQLAYAGKNGDMWLPSSPSHNDIKSIVKAFGEGAARAKLSGFDGVQIHAAHGYFLSQFLSRQNNTRQDEYGGIIENRARILLEIYDEIRNRTGSNFSIFIKINGTDAFDETEGVNACSYACRQLAARGIDAIEISGGADEIKKSLDNPHKESIFRDYAARIAEEVRVPVILVGHNRTPSVMEKILNTSAIEYFALSRPLLREPNLVNDWKNNRNKKAECISCNACFKPDGNICVFGP